MEAAGQCLGVGQLVFFEVSPDTVIDLCADQWIIEQGSTNADRAGTGDQKFDGIFSAGHTALAYVFSGEAALGGPQVRVASGQAALFGPGDRLELALAAQAEAPAELLVLAGPPLGEPIARYGPFVMNDYGQIQQAVRDYQAGRMGQIEPELE